MPHPTRSSSSMPVIPAVVLALAALLLGLLVAPATAQDAEELIAFENRYDEEQNLDRIEVMAPDGSDRRVVVDNAYSAALSPDGSRLAFVRDSDIWVVDLGSGEESVVSAAPQLENGPAWSPDGALLAFSRIMPSGDDCTHLRNGEIVVTDFTDEVQLTGTECLSEGGPDFSPDGSRVAFHSLYLDTDFDGASVITTVELETSASQDITGSDEGLAFYPAWSPDGSQILFDGTFSVYSVPANGGESTAVVSDSELPEECGGPSQADWSPDGQRIAFGMSCDGIGVIATIAAEGGAIEHLTEADTDASNPSWAAVDLDPDPDPDPDPVVVRVDGGGRNDPVGQAIATSQALFPDGAADRVVLATADRFPDALAGSALAGDDGPILLTPFGDQLDPRVAAEITRVTGGEGVALILGGTAAVTESAAGQARTAAGSTTCSAPFPADCRYAGSPGREDTAARIAVTVLAEHGGDRALLARGDVFADAITGGAYAARAGVPILLTPPDQLNGSTRAFLETNPIGEVIVLGGIAAVDQPTMDAVPVEVRRRIEGRERTETAAAIATQLWQADGLGAGGSVLVNVRDADGWQTALAGAVYAAVLDAPQLGVENPPAAPTQATLDAADALGGTVRTLGGTDLVSDAQLSAVRAAAD